MIWNIFIQNNFNINKKMDNGWIITKVHSINKKYLFIYK